MSETERKIGRDLKLAFDDLGADLIVSKQRDLDTVAEEDNLAQAIITRLSTEEGELSDIGHSDYGSRLYEVIGEINNEATRQRIKALVRECLFQEVRVKEVVNIKVQPNPYDLQRVDIEMTVLPIKSSIYLTITYPFHLE